MSGVRFLLAFLSLPLVGIPFQRFRIFRSLHPAARLGLAGALGALALSVEMLLLTAFAIHWSIWVLLALPAAFGLARRGRYAMATPLGKDESAPSLASMVTVVVLAVVAYAAATARATSSDLLLFWGAKGQRFAQAGAIDVGFLRDPAHFLMHPDYPPMLPCLYAWATVVAGRFAWGASLLTLPLFLGLSALTFFGFSRPVLGRRVATEYTSVLTALLGCVLVVSLTAGNADPLLLYFEVLTLSALVFAGERPEGVAAAALGLAGAVLTKVEGTAFAVIVVVAYSVFFRKARDGRSLELLAAPPALALAAWFSFCHLNRLIDVYRIHSETTPMLAHLPMVFRKMGAAAGYGLAFIPWIVVLVLALGRQRTAGSTMALAVGSGFLAFVFYLYLRVPGDPSLWITWSASRLLITPLTCVFVSAAAPVRNARIFA